MQQHIFKHKEIKRINKSILLAVVAADVSVKSPRRAASSLNSRHKYRQRCPCGKKLSVALISLETDALDILTSGVNNTNGKKQQKRMDEIESSVALIRFTRFCNMCKTKSSLHVRLIPAEPFWNVVLVV